MAVVEFHFVYQEKYGIRKESGHRKATERQETDEPCSIVKKRFIDNNIALNCN